MRISDWSSDVCSSDLLGRAIYRLVADRPLTPGLHRLGFSFTRDEATQSGGLARLFINSQQVAEQVLPRTVRFSYSGSGELFGIGEDSGTTVTSDYAAPFPFTGEIERVTVDVERSEEHTSELQSLMRISYAVFCLKKQKNTRI